MRLLFIGDIVGRAGRRAVRELLPGLVEKYAPDAVIANGENAAGGKGISSKVADNLFQLGVSVITMGNHTWGNKEIFALLETERRLVRPLNYPPGLPGQGWLKIETSKGPLVVVNLLGRTGMAGPIDCPFQAMERLLAEVDAPVVVDFHAETTSEKAALAWFLAGRAAAVVGTHTHVQTADCRILPGSTAFITDLGMTGPVNSILGVKTETIINRFRTGLPERFEVASGPAQLAGAFVELEQGKAIRIESFCEYTDREEDEGGTC